MVGALKVLLEYGADPASEDLMGSTAFVDLVEIWEKLFLRLKACKVYYANVPEGFVDLFSTILETKKNVSFLANACKDPHLLCLALIFGRERLADQILQHSPSVDAIAYRILRMNPLQAACYYGRCSGFLLEELHGRSKADRGAGGEVSGLLLFACEGAASSME